MNTRQQILNATERIIQAKGIARATTKEIARAAGCAEGTLYKHFEHKEELFLTVLQQHLPSFIESMGGIEPGTLPILTSLERIAQAALHYYEKMVPLVTAFFADTDLLASHRKLMQDIDGGPQRIHERVAGYVRQEQQLGRIDAGQEPLSIAWLLLGPCFQYVFTRNFLGNDPFALTDEQFIANLVRTLAVGLLPASRNGQE